MVNGASSCVKRGDCCVHRYTAVSRMVVLHRRKVYATILKGSIGHGLELFDSVKLEVSAGRKEACEFMLSSH